MVWINILQQEKNQSKDLTLEKEFVIQYMEPPTWTQSSQELVSLDRENLGLLAGEAIPKALFKGGGNIIRSDNINHVLTNSGELTLESDSFTFDPLKAETFMVVPLNETFLACDRDVHSTSVIGASRPDQSRIVAPGMNEDISSRDDVRSTFQNDVGKADKLDTSA